MPPPRFRPATFRYSRALLLLTLGAVACSGGVEVGPTVGVDGGDGGHPSTADAALSVNVDADQSDRHAAPLDGGHDASPGPGIDAGGSPLPDSGAPQLDAMKVTTAMPDSGAASDAGAVRDSGAAPVDASVDSSRLGSPDAAGPHDAKLPDARAAWPDAAGIAAACETCLDSTCGSDVAACEADPNCETSIECAVESGCLAAGSSGIQACVEACITTAGLTPHEEVLVVQEITAISQCATPCLASCGGVDAGK